MGLFDSPARVFGLALSLRLSLLLYGIYQDNTSNFKYTDIDYNVFVDAAKYVAHGQSPYTRDTYRYTPLLAWLLVPTSFGGPWLHFGKLLFLLSDLVAGWFIMKMLLSRGFNTNTALRYASFWLLNPMVANISTRGSSEGFVCAVVLSILYAFETTTPYISGALLGIAVHLKIYPFIYGFSFLLALQTPPLPRDAIMPQIFNSIVSTKRTQFAISALAAFTLLNSLMYKIYGPEFLDHTFKYHLTRIDHRHNFSPYFPSLYLSSHSPSSLRLESLAFAPQLLLSVIAIPALLATRDLPGCLFTQTLAFTTFNKVATSQYFLWPLVVLPLALPGSVFMRRPLVGVFALLAWAAGQAFWLAAAFRLELLGRSSWVLLWVAGLFFFGVNCSLLRLAVRDSFTEVGRQIKKMN
jgi:GPI mannosyltransferase 1 subunit M